MKVQSATTVPLQAVTMEGSSGCQVRWLIGAADQAPNFAMRQFEVAPGGFTPRHQHDYEHEVYVLSGQGQVFADDKPQPLAAGDVVLVRPNEVHQFRNTGSVPLVFLCLVPNSAQARTVTVVPECGVERPAAAG